MLIERKQQNKKLSKNKGIFPTYGFLVTIIVAIFTVEFSSMLVLQYFNFPFSEPVEIFLDSFILVIVLFPILYLLFFRSLVHQISERKLAHEKLIELKEFSHELISNTTIPTFVLDSQHKVIIWNKACEELTGIKADYMIGTDNHWQPFYPTKRPCVADIILNGAIEELPEYYVYSVKSDLITKGIHAEAWIEKNGGQKRYLVMEAAPILNAKREAIAVIETIQDLTDRKLSEESIYESEQQFRATFDQAALGIVHADLDGRWIKVNQKFCDMVGYTEQEATNLKFKDITYPDDLAADLEHVEQLLSGKIEHFAMEKRYYHKNGSLIWVNLTASLVRESSGEPKYFIGVIEDITKRKLMELQIQAQNNRIQEELKLASSIQTDLFPIDLPRAPGVTVAAAAATAKEVGGDYCDLLITRKEKLAIAIGDVMGKGVGAALFMAMTYAYIRNYAFEMDSTSALVNKVNCDLYKLLDSNAQFITLFYGIYDPATRELNYTNAGHNPPIIYRAATGECEKTDVRDYFIGGRRLANYRESKLILEQGDIILFYTDGLKEGMNKDQEQFGTHRIESIIKEHHTQDAASVLDILHISFVNFLQGEPLYDDVTLILLKVDEQLDNKHMKLIKFGQNN